jgi:tetratricopeptide (TPR) repeat protein
MELVKGVPITQFCDARKLTPRQRLELIVPVCQAIQHAHQKGIIHRDIKPSNVLIALYDDRPVPKVIDFGVAKAAGAQLTDKSLHTGFGAVVGTPQYMSPEQATLNNLDIDTRSDIYSLGVLLYELLTGSPPFAQTDLKKAGILEVLRVIREEEPPKPSTRVSTAEALPSLAANRGTEPAKLTRQMRGEIDWIVMKALEKDRGRRYDTANGFALDIQRYLADEALVAGPPSAGYRLRKFVKRHKGQVAAAVAVLVVLLVGIAGTAWGLMRAEMARQAEAEQRKIAVDKQCEAEEQKERAQQAERDTLADYRASTDDAIEQLIGSKPELGVQEKTYLEKTLKRWQTFAARVGDDRQSRVIRAEGRFRVALLLQKLGQIEKAVAGYRDVLPLYEELAREFPADPYYLQNLAGTHHNLALLFTSKGQAEKARERFAKALAIRQKLAEDFPSVRDHRQQLAYTHMDMGSLLINQDRAKAAEEYSRALTIVRKLADESPAVPAYRHDLARVYYSLGSLLLELNQLEKAAPHIHTSLAIQQKLANEFAGDRRMRQDLARSHFALGNLCARQAQWEQAAESFLKGLDIQRKLAGDFPAVPEYSDELALTHNALGNLLKIQKQGEKAGEQFRMAISIRQKLVDRFPAVPAYQVGFGGSCYNYGDFLRESGKPADSLRWYNKAIRTVTTIHEQDPGAVYPREVLFKSHFGRVVAQTQLDNHADAVNDWDQALALGPPPMALALGLPPMQRLLRAFRAYSRARSGQLASAVADAAELTRSGNWPVGQWYDFACIYALASGKLADKKQEYADRAMELLHQAVKSGFNDATHMAKDTDLDVLRQRDDFKKLLKSLAKSKEKAPPPKAPMNRKAHE